MKEERPNWNKESAKEIKEGKEEFFGLEFELLNIMVKFSLRALKTFNASAGNDGLNPLQVNNITAHEIQSVIEDIRRPQFMELIIKKTEQDFYSDNFVPLKQKEGQKV